MYEIDQDRFRRIGRTFQAVASDLWGHAMNPQQPSRYPIVAMYHSVSERGNREWGPWKYAITPNEFELQLSRINENHNVISFDSLLRWMVGDESIPDNSVVLTFDDAYCDFQNTALPILEKYEFQTTVYVSTALLGSSKAPFEQRLGEVLSKQNNLDISIDGFNIDAELGTHEQVVDCYREVVDRLKRRPVGVQESLLEAIEAEPESKDVILNPEGLRDLQHHPLVTIGAHGHEHVPFTTLSHEEQRENITKCRNQLTNILDSAPRHFSFPYGSFNKSAIRALKNSGFDSGVTTQSRPISARDWGRPYRIPRIDAATRRDLLV